MKTKIKIRMKIKIKIKTKMKIKKKELVSLKNVDVLENSYKITVMNLTFYLMDTVKRMKPTVNYVLVSGVMENLTEMKVNNKKIKMKMKIPISLMKMKMKTKIMMLFQFTGAD